MPSRGERRARAATTLLFFLTGALFAAWATRIPAVKDEVHAVGVQIGLTHVPTNMALTFHYFNEFDSKDRFQGESIGLNFAIKF